MEIQDQFPKQRLRHNVAIVVGSGVNALGAVRGLEMKGIGSILACRSGSRWDPAYMSRLPIRRVRIPSEVDLADWLTDFICSVAGEADCIVPTSDECAEVLRELREGSRIPLVCVLPPRDLVDVLNDKKIEVEFIRALDIPIPATVSDLSQSGIGKDGLQFPVIVKPRTYKGYAILGCKNQIVRSEPEFEAFLRRFEHNLEDFIAQEVIPGDESCQWVCNATFDHDSNMVSAFTFQRHGTAPYLYGVTTFATSKHNQEVKKICAKLGNFLKYTGPAMIEFKRDPRSGHYNYIEINPRLGMCNWFDTRCGVNNVYNSYALSVRIPTEINVDRQIDGKTYINVALDLYARVRAQESIWAILRCYVRNMSLRVVPSTWYWRDPVPVFAQFLRFALHKMSRLR